MNYINNKMPKVFALKGYLLMKAFDVPGNRFRRLESQKPPGFVKNTKFMAGKGATPVDFRK